MKIVADFLARSAAASVRSPRRTLALWIAAMALSITAAVLRVEFRTSNLDLIDPELPPVKRFLDFAREFGTPNVLAVVVEGGERPALEDAVVRIAAEVRKQPGIRAVIDRLPLEKDLLQDLGMEEFLSSRDHGMYFLFVQPSDPSSAVTSLDPFVKSVRAAVDAAGLPAGLKVGFTGIPQYALDDRDIIQRDSTVLSIASFVMVFVIFRSCFNRARRPVYAMATLLATVVVNAGFVAFYPGHLTLLSASFASVSFGLGVDYGIHIINRLEELMARGVSEKEGIPLAVRDIASEIATGALTTAGMFYAMNFCGFQGFEELGVIAATGVLACMYGMCTLLPALLCLHPSRGEAEVLGRQANRIGEIMLRAQGRWVTAGVGLACVGLIAIGGPGFDTDYLDLQPKDSETVRLEREMERRSDVSPQFAVFTTDSMAKASALSERLLRLNGLVSDVRCAADLENAAPGENLLAKLPEAYRLSLVSSNGLHAVYAYPEGNAWDPAVQRKFADAMEAVDPNVTGMPILGRFLVERSREALRNSIVFGLPVLVILVLLDFRRPLPALFALTPTLLCYGVTMGCLNLLGLPMNPLNLMALPVVLGIAVDDGVHITSRFLAEKGDVRAVLLGSGRSVFLTNATTVAAFASLAITSHRGLASFAIALSLGVAIAFLLSVFLLPGLLSAAHRRGWLKA